jgi:phosphoribosylformylglycinamidine synthase
MVGTKAGYDAPPAAFAGEGTVLVVGDRVLAGESAGLGGSEYLAQHGGTDRYPTLPDRAPALVETLAAVANRESTLASHDVSHGGLAVALAEMVTDTTGAGVTLPAADASAAELLFHEQPGRAVIETTDPDGVREAFDGVAPVHAIGHADGEGRLSVDVGGDTFAYNAGTIRDLRSVIERELE